MQPDDFDLKNLLKPGWSDLPLTLAKKALLLKHSIKADSSIPLTYFLQSIPEKIKLIVNGDEKKIEHGLFVGTTRMGYGQHRMAYAAYSWALEETSQVYLHDLLGIESPHSGVIREVDTVYSAISRTAAEFGGLLESIWGFLTSSGNLGTLKFSCMLAQDMIPLAGGLPKDSPYISTYPMNGQIAHYSGFQKIINMVPDNHPQYYLLVPGAVNLVQSHFAYMKFLEMGVPKGNLKVAGHWVPRNITINIKKDSEKRIKRAEKKSPMRILYSIGGAGAGKNYLYTILKQMKDVFQDGDIRLFINLGDHTGILKSLMDVLEKNGLEYLRIETDKELQYFISKNQLGESEKNIPPIVLFCFDDFFQAFSATDLLIRISDVLATKPSELAFYPIPKIFTRRVGDHEALSACRSNELGEGSTECREPEHVVDIIKLLISNRDLLIRMNECILRNNENKVYHGAQFAVHQALFKQMI